jgi:hypothetical protein
LPDIFWRGVQGWRIFTASQRVGFRLTRIGLSSGCSQGPCHQGCGSIRARWTLMCSVRRSRVRTRCSDRAAGTWLRVLVLQRSSLYICSCVQVMLLSEKKKKKKKKQQPVEVQTCPFCVAHAGNTSALLQSIVSYQTGLHLSFNSSCNSARRTRPGTVVVAPTRCKTLQCCELNMIIICTRRIYAPPCPRLWSMLFLL